MTPGIWEALRGARLFLTGGTGFFGTWLIESLVHADRALSLGVRATVLTRNADAFLAKNPHLAGAAGLSFHHGDVRNFDFPAGEFTHAILAATEASARLNREQPDLMRDVIVSGSRRTLEFAASCGVKRLLFVSSGAVYGRQRSDVTHVSEDAPGFSARMPVPDAYAEGKRAAEKLCLDAASRGLEVTIARCFAFVGPHLPLDAHFAIGNFIRDALRGGPVLVNGDGSPCRSYLYASDLAIWLWTIFLRGAPGRAYNVGSERRVTMAELAYLVAAQVTPGAEVRVACAPEPGKPAEQYVPSVERARAELGLRETVTLEDAVKRTAAWARR